MRLISYNRLFKLMIDKGIKKTELAKMEDLSQTTLAKLSKNQYVSIDVLLRICDSLDCTFDEIIELVKVAEDETTDMNGGAVREEQ